MLREKTQRRLFRVLFTLGCIIPTLLIGGWAVARYTPIYKMIAMSVINEATGLEVNCRQLTTPRPGEYQLTEVSVHDPITERLLATIDDLTIRQPEEEAIASNWEAIAGNVWIAEPTVSTEDRIPLQLTDFEESIRCSAESVAIASEANTWRDVKIQFEPATMEQPAKLSAVATASDTRLEVIQQQVKHSVNTGIKLKTGTQPIALDLIPIGEEYESVTRGGEFLGYAEVSLSGNKQQASIKDSVIKLSEGSYKLGNDPITWNSADIQIRKLRWIGPVVSVEASLMAEEGFISPNTVFGMHQYLKCIPSDQLIESWEDYKTKPIAFDRVDIQVSLNPLHFSLNLSASNPQNALITSGDEPLLFAPSERISPLAIVQAFNASDLELLPNNPKAHRLVQMLLSPKTETE